MPFCRTWEIRFKGGFANGHAALSAQFPEPLLFCWPHDPAHCSDPGCVAHFTFDVDFAALNAVAYRRKELDSDMAVYTLGDLEPEYGEVAEERVLVGAEAGSTKVNFPSRYFGAE